MTEPKARAPSGVAGRTLLRSLPKLALVFLLAIVAGAAFRWLQSPLPWMLGPLVATALAYGTGLFRTSVPVGVRPFGQTVVALQVGLYFSPSAFEAVWSLAPLLVGMALLTTGWSVVVSMVLARMTGLSVTTACVATMPTSPVEASVLAEKIGAEQMPVVLAQTIRIAAVVLIVPLALQFLVGQPANPASTMTALQPSIGDTALLAALGLSGALLFRSLRVSNPYFLGPLAMSAGITAAGMQIAPFDGIVLAAAQIVLGTWLGSVFTRDRLRTARRLAMSCFLTTVLLIGLACGSAAILGQVIGVDPVLMVLGAAPGGVTEMALTAQFLGSDVALITAFHLTRIFLIMPNLPWIVSLMHRGRSGNGSSKENEV